MGGRRFNGIALLRGARRVDAHAGVCVATRRELRTRARARTQGRGRGRERARARGGRALPRAPAGDGGRAWRRSGAPSLEVLPLPIAGINQQGPAPVFHATHYASQRLVHLLHAGVEVRVFKNIGACEPQGLVACISSLIVGRSGLVGRVSMPFVDAFGVVSVPAVVADGVAGPHPSSCLVLAEGSLPSSPVQRQVMLPCRWLAARMRARTLRLLLKRQLEHD